MNKTFFSVLFFLSFVVLLTYLNSCFVVTRTDANEATRLLNQSLYQELSKPNRWGGVFQGDPLMDQHGLTYTIEVWMEMKNVKFNHVEDVQQLFLDVYSDFLPRMNNIRIIRPFLAEFPLTPSSFQLHIRFKDANNSHVMPPFILSVGLFNYEIGSKNDFLEFGQYVKLEEGIADRPYKVICRRSAHDIVHLRELYSSNVPRSSLGFKVSVPENYTPFFLEKPSKANAELEFVKKFCVKANLKLITLGYVGEHYFDSRKFNFALRGSQCLSMNEARKLGAECLQELWDFIRKDTRCLEYIKETSSIPHDKYPSPTPIPEHLAFRISFWDENVDRVPEPYIAEIRLLDAKLKYFTADENQFLVQVYEETFDNALAFLHNQKGIEPSNPN